MVPEPSRRLAWSACSFALAASLGGAARAQAPATLETVIVTAERRGQDVQRTPSAVTALGGKALDEGFITHINGLNGQDFKGRDLTVNEARPREDRGGGGGARGGYGGGRGGYGGGGYGDRY